MAAQDFSAVIYRARTEALAHRLVEKLDEIPVEAVVAPETFGGMEAGDAGYRVCVRAFDQPSAEKAVRLFVEDYLNGRPTVDEDAGEDETAWDSESTESLRHWPVCPECDSPRIARCDVCGRTGVDFPPNDPDFDWGMGQEHVEDAEETPGCSCQSSCHSEACASGEPGDEAGDGAHTENSLPCEEGPDDEKIILRCTSCDEPFVPQFADRCPWCDHAFEDGFELEVGEEGLEVHSGRAVAAFVVLLGICAVFLLYVMYVYN